MNAPTSTFEISQYGAPIGEYRGSTTRIIIGIAGALALVAVAYTGFVYIMSALDPISDMPDRTAGVILAVLFLATAIYCFVTLYLWRGAHAQLFERGFSVSRGGKTTTARWDDVTSVTQRVVQSRYYGIPIYTSHCYDITLANGERLRVNDAFGKVGKLGDAIQRMSANALLPRAIASYHSGAALPFGKLSVSQAGISNGKETLPWNDLNQLTLLNGYVYIMRKGKRLRWTSARISATPNVYVLMALVGYIQRGVR